VLANHLSPGAISPLNIKPDPIRTVLQAARYGSSRRMASRCRRLHTSVDSSSLPVEYTASASCSRILETERSNDVRRRGLRSVLQAGRRPSCRSSIEAVVPPIRTVLCGRRLGTTGQLWHCREDAVLLTSVLRTILVPGEPPGGISAVAVAHTH
jgi:hypothetical protein